MFWPLVKITLFIVIVGTFSAGLALLMNINGTVTFELFDLAIQTDLINLVLLLLILIPILWGMYFLVGLCIAIIRFIVGDETAFTRYLNKNKTRKGFQALADSMVALASGEPALAKSKINLAEKYLKQPELTGLLAAQTAERMGDTAKAQEVYKQLLQNQKTRFIGVAGILKHRLENNDTSTALKLAEKAHQLRPHHEETLNILFKLQAQSQDWIGAEKTLKAKFSRNQFDRKDYKHHRAVILFAQANLELSQDNSRLAKSKIFEANNLAPDLIPAAILAAQFKVEGNDKKAATRVLMNAWNLLQHPDIVSAYSEIEPNESLQERYKRFKKIINKTLTHSESRMAMAELAISRHDFVGARRELETLPDTDPTVRTYLILAAIERGIGAEEGKVQTLLAKALTAANGPQWVCNTCQYVHENWEPICSNCQDFDSIWWQRNDKANQKLVSSIKLLPMRNDDDNSKGDLEEQVKPDEIIRADEITEISDN
ncbi:MAG: heme biosynthesis protein HemY [Rhodobacteraceae bacterium]|nr:heme biosynthesis protein HemY [Paracoccaceae bacterium]